MTLLAVNNVRNLVDVKLHPAERFNLFYGANGSGKTSLIEAIYFLGLGRSFRSRLHSRIIQHGATHFSLFSQIQCGSQLLPVGMERHINGDSRIRIAQENVRSIVEVTRLLPLQLLNPDSRFLLLGSSKLRRQFIDWGLFHVEPTFLKSWQHAQRALKQRNAALKSHASHTLVRLWDAELEVAAQVLHQQRKAYVAELTMVFSRIIQEFLTAGSAVSLQYKSGWDESLGLNEVLEKSLSRDLQLGYTQYGPHRADLLIRVDRTLPAQDILSQGQQKLVVYALHLAQGILLKQQTGKRCIYLLDDLAAELDTESRHRVASVLSEIDAQVFVTGVDRQALVELEQVCESRLFHVEQGKIAVEVLKSL
ncbi:MAG TPA: DNA replication/repair protein RecF [Gammaproteobacteria bacterium]|nr:DNA replication/repair protein RecF [Gammaproteobacteria bacterium]